MIGKKWRRILIFSIIMCLNACGNTLCTKDEMLQAMKKWAEYLWRDSRMWKYCS